MPRRPPETDPRVAIAYVRTSTEEQNLGPEAQRAAIAAWARASNIVVAATFEDRASGAAPIDKRPGLIGALDALTIHGAGRLVIAKRDRLARDVVVGAMIERLVERAGARVMSADGTGNGEGPEALLLRGIVDVFAEYERALIRTRTRAALATKRARGERVGTIPFGHRLAADGVHFEPDEHEQRVIALIQELRGAGRSLRAVRHDLAVRGILSRSGRAFSLSRVHAIVQRLETR